VRVLASLALIGALAVHLGPAGAPSSGPPFPNPECVAVDPGLGLAGLGLVDTHPALPALEPTTVEGGGTGPTGQQRRGTEGVKWHALPHPAAASAPVTSPASSGARLLGLAAHPANAPPARF